MSKPLSKKRNSSVNFLGGAGSINPANNSKSPRSKSPVSKGQSSRRNSAAFSLQVEDALGDAQVVAEVDELSDIDPSSERRDSIASSASTGGIIPILGSPVTDLASLNQQVLVTQTALDAELTTIREQLARVDDNDRLIAVMNNNTMALHSRAGSELDDLLRQVKKAEEQLSGLQNEQAILNRTVGDRERKYKKRQMTTALQQAALTQGFASPQKALDEAEEGMFSAEMGMSMRSTAGDIPSAQMSFLSTPCDTPTTSVRYTNTVDSRDESGVSPGLGQTPTLLPMLSCEVGTAEGIGPIEEQGDNSVSPVASRRPKVAVMTSIYQPPVMASLSGSVSPYPKVLGGSQGGGLPSPKASSSARGASSSSRNSKERPPPEAAKVVESVDDYLDKMNLHLGSLGSKRHAATARGPAPPPKEDKPDTEDPAKRKEARRRAAALKAMGSVAEKKLQSKT